MVFTSLQLTTIKASGMLSFSQSTTRTGFSTIWKKVSLSS
ncbi:hypothetical protein F443_14663 [Phytophthora nicotianae P1569]|uniref:Uncharacterized protein n=1 Tax=Phytophthora nicotianae P1569 TaxID=1317065 RepID=V9ENX3_PHYNI|nr:hypothetical protein F443_14663 [Phytophthora nicotianae P1569]